MRRQQQPLALIHGYHVAFVWGAALLACALLCAVFLVNAKKDDLPADADAWARREPLRILRAPGDCARREGDVSP